MNERELADLWFPRLQALLPNTPLDTEAGPKRIADVGEFMFMGENRGSGSFKHRDTRNYLFVQRKGAGYEIFVPKSTHAFQKGTFDTFNVELPKELLPYREIATYNLQVAKENLQHRKDNAGSLFDIIDAEEEIKKQERILARLEIK